MLVALVVDEVRNGDNLHHLLLRCRYIKRFCIVLARRRCY